jgi:hypothetical protein
MNNSNLQNISFFHSQRFTFLKLFMVLTLNPAILLGTIAYLQATVNLARTVDNNLEQLGKVQLSASAASLMEIAQGLQRVVAQFTLHIRVKNRRYHAT